MSHGFLRWRWVFLCFGSICDELSGKVEDQIFVVSWIFLDRSRKSWFWPPSFPSLNMFKIFLRFLSSVTLCFLLHLQLRIFPKLRSVFLDLLFCRGWVSNFLLWFGFFLPQSDSKAFIWFEDEWANILLLFRSAIWLSVLPKNCGKMVRNGRKLLPALTRSSVSLFVVDLKLRVLLSFLVFIFPSSIIEILKNLSPFLFNILNRKR